MGLVNHYYNLEAKAEDPDLPTENWYFPADQHLGALLIVTAVSKVKGTDKEADAEKLVEFLLSKQSQQFFAQETFEYPLVDGVEPAETVPPLAGLAVTRVDLDELGGGLKRTQALIDDSGITKG